MTRLHPRIASAVAWATVWVVATRLVNPGDTSSIWLVIAYVALLLGLDGLLGVFIGGPVKENLARLQTLAVFGAVWAGVWGGAGFLVERAGLLEFGHIWPGLGALFGSLVGGVMGGLVGSKTGPLFLKDRRLEVVAGAVGTALVFPFGLRGGVVSITDLVAFVGFYALPALATGLVTVAVTRTLTPSTKLV